MTFPPERSYSTSQYLRSSRAGIRIPPSPKKTSLPPTMRKNVLSIKELVEEDLDTNEELELPIIVGMAATPPNQIPGINFAQARALAQKVRFLEDKIKYLM